MGAAGDIFASAVGKTGVYRAGAAPATGTGGWNFDPESEIGLLPLLAGGQGENWLGARHGRAYVSAFERTPGKIR